MLIATIPITFFFLHFTLTCTMYFEGSLCKENHGYPYIKKKQNKYGEIFFQTDLLWQEINLLSRSVTIGSKSREFHYKFAHRIVYTNRALLKLGIVILSTCMFCGKSEESLEHLYIYCEITPSLLLSVTEWLKDYLIAPNYIHFWIF